MTHVAILDYLTVVLKTGISYLFVIENPLLGGDRISKVFEHIVRGTMLINHIALTQIMDALGGNGLILRVGILQVPFGKLASCFDICAIRVTGVGRTASNKRRQQSSLADQ